MEEIKFNQEEIVLIYQSCSFMLKAYAACGQTNDELSTLKALVNKLDDYFKTPD